MSNHYLYTCGYIAENWHGKTDEFFISNGNELTFPGAHSAKYTARNLVQLEVEQTLFCELN